MTTRGVRANSALALAGDGASKASALVVVVIGARYLDVAQFAALATGLAVAGVLTATLDLGAGTLLTRDGATSREARGRLFAASMRARLPIFGLVVLLSPLAGVPFGRPLGALSVAVLAVSGALALSVVGLYRSCRDIRPEALQRLAAGTLAVLATAGAAAVAPRADVVLLALGATTLVTIAPLALRAPAVADLTAGVSPVTAVRSAAPIGLLALATIAYYRSGTIVLAAISDAKATAAFGVAAGIAFGLLLLPNAITTALLPRLAVERGLDGLVATTRRALAWTVVLAAGLAAASAVVVPAVLPLALGPEYADAAAPFALLCLGIPAIAASGVIGTALLTLGRLRVLGAQVCLSLAVNLAVLLALVPALGAVGAAAATVACETVGLLLLLQVARSELPGLLVRGTFAQRRIEDPETALP